MEFLTGFESTYMPAHDVDVLRLTGHDERWRDDLRLVRDAGIRRLRYPIPWHRVERERGRYDWGWVDAVLAGMRELGLSPIVDPLHHTSFPRWLDDGFLNPDFPAAYADFCAAFAARYGWVREYTVFNEPLPTTLLCTEMRVWPPARPGTTAFYRMVHNVARAICLATAAILGQRADARFIHVDTAEGHGALDAESEGFVAYLNQRRFLFHDLILGRVDDAHPLWPALRDEGGWVAADLAWFRANAARIDVLGLDYYPHCEHQFHVQGSTCPSRAPQSFAALARQYHARYGIPIMLTETNIRGYISDRITWLRHMVEECEQLEREGIPFEGFTWFPFIDSTDWDTLLTVARGRIDPVGLYWLREGTLERCDSELSRLYRGLARGELRAEDLPAYSLVAPVTDHLAGFQPRWANWAWREPVLAELPAWAWPVAQMGADMRFAAQRVGKCRFRHETCPHARAADGRRDERVRQMRGGSVMAIQGWLRGVRGGNTAAGGAATTTEQPDRPSLFDALSVPDYRRLWLGSLVSNIGTWMQLIGSGWLVLQLTNSPFWLGVESFAAAAPILVFSLPAGVVADRVDRRRLLLALQSATGVLALLLAVLTWSGVVQLWHILGITLLMGACQAFTMPAWQAMIPDLVGKDRLMNAVGLNSAAYNGAAVIGPSLAGLIVGAFGVAACFAINAASYLAVIGALVTIATHCKGAECARNVNVLESIGEGLSFIRRRRVVFALFALAAIVSLAARPYLQLLPVFARDVLGGDSRTYGLLMAANGAGALAGSLLTAALVRVPRKGLLLLGSAARLPLA